MRSARRVNQLALFFSRVAQTAPPAVFRCAVCSSSGFMGACSRPLRARPRPAARKNALSPCKKRSCSRSICSIQNACPASRFGGSPPRLPRPACFAARSISAAPVSPLQRIWSYRRQNAHSSRYRPLSTLNPSFASAHARKRRWPIGFSSRRSPAARTPDKVFQRFPSRD